MPPALKEVILNNFNFFLTLGVFMTWMILIQYSVPIIKIIRRLTLLAFTYLSFSPFKTLTHKFVAWIDLIEIDIFMRRVFVQTKGTDWVDGFFWGIAVFLYGIFIAVLWARDLSK